MSFCCSENIYVTCLFCYFILAFTVGMAREKKSRRRGQGENVAQSVKYKCRTFVADLQRGELS